ncbi:MAG: hypothetical protein BV458_01475 [Thermoplasmata archaeon M9B2D]|nr:MAG: hypothetical protein BV458_01475 [Thermoplasmata archaeon M9B2D]
MRRSAHWFEQGVEFSKKYFFWLHKNPDKTQQKLTRYFPLGYEDALTLSDLNVERSGVLLFAHTSALLSFIGFLGLYLFVFFASTLSILKIDTVPLVLLTLMLIVIPFVIMNLIFNFPLSYARNTQIHSLGDIPEILSYLVMYLKLVPNLENSLKFAASESSTTLAYDLRKLLWDMEIRVYHGAHDALSHFATRWGRFSEYFKRSLHLIQSSLHEKNEVSRIVTLDRALDVSLEGTKETMNQYANKLHQPTVILYSIGIMIPLSLVAMLPAAGLVGIRITLLQMFALYDILLPLFVFFYTRKILLSRPAAFNPSIIPRDHPELVGIHIKKRLVVAVAVGFCISLPGFFLILLSALTHEKTSSLFFNIYQMTQGINAFFPVPLFFIWGVAATLSIYCVGVYGPYKKVRDNIRQMENEFSDALYILGKRISEEKSPEESFAYTAVTMQKSMIADLFRQTSYNLIAMHTNIHDALYNHEFGSMKDVYSNRIKAIMRLFVEGTQKSQQATSASLIRIADHLKQLQEIEKKIRDMLYELTSTLRTTIMVFAPLIAGVTLAITQLISTILTSFHSNAPSISSTGSPLSFSENAQSFMVENVRPEFFVLIIGIYLIELVFLLTRFINGLNEGDDKATFLYSLGKSMPMSIVVFSVTIILGQFFFMQILPSS